jgi:predicted dehydrogenase
MNHANGATSSVQFSWAVKSGGQPASEVYGTEGTLRFRWDDRPLALFENRLGEWVYPELAADAHSFSTLLTGFLIALQTGEALPVTGKDARRNLAIVMSGYESARTGEVVRIVAG